MLRIPGQYLSPIAASVGLVLSAMSTPSLAITPPLNPYVYPVCNNFVPTSISQIVVDYDKALAIIYGACLSRVNNALFGTGQDGTMRLVNMKKWDIDGVPGTTNDTAIVIDLSEVTHCVCPVEPAGLASYGPPTDPPDFGKTGCTLDSGEHMVLLRNAANGTLATWNLTLGAVGPKGEAGPVEPGGTATTIFMARSDDQIKANETKYFAPTGSNKFDGNEAKVATVMPIACAATDLTVLASDTSSTIDGGEGVTVTLRVNGANTTQSCVLTTGLTTCTTADNTPVSIAAGNTVSIGVVNTDNDFKTQISAGWVCTESAL